MAEDCIFCKIADGIIPSKKVFENENVLAFYDISPKAPKHILVIPKRHIGSLIEVGENDKDLLGELMLTTAEIAGSEGIDKSGYKVVANNGSGSGQLVFHLHFHLLGGWKNKVVGWKV